MNSLGKENITQLTKNGIRDLIERRKKNTVVQILEIQKLTKKDANAQNSDKFRVVISDGDTKQKCILGNNAAKIAEQVDMKPFTVIQANEHLHNINENKTPIIIITDLEIIHSNITETIGNPIDWPIYQQNGYQNPNGNNQIPVKYLTQQKPPTSSSTGNRNIGGSNPTSSTAASNTTQTNQNRANTTAQPQNNLGTTKPTLSPNASNQPKGNKSGPDSGFQIQNNNPTNNPIMVSKANPTPANAQNTNTGNPSLAYQRTASFGNQNQNLGTLTSTRNAGGQKGSKAVDYVSNAHKKLSELSYDDFMPISALVANNPGFTIRAKVTKKSELREYQKNEQWNQVFSIELADQDGGEIQGTFFGDTAALNFPKIQENHVYAFSGGTVKLANTKFQSVKNDYQIIFDKTTQIEEVQDDGTIQGQNFKFISISDVEKIEINTNVDFLALVREVDSCNDIPLKKGDSKPRRIIEIFDSSLYTVELVLWGDIAKNCVPKKNSVIIGRGLRISEFLGKRNLSFNQTVSQILWGDSLPKLPEIQELVRWRDSTRIDESELVQLSRAGDRHARFAKTIDQIEDECAGLQNERKYFDVRVYISHIKTDDTMYYYSCTNDSCMKKLYGDDISGWTCSSCNLTYTKPVLRYTLSLKIDDNTNSVWTTAFNKEAEFILDATAEQMKEMKDSGQDNKIAELVKEACCYEWKMKLMAKQSQVNQANTENRIRYQVVKCQKIDFSAESKSIIKILELY